MAYVLSGYSWDLSVQGVTAHPTDVVTGEGGAFEDPYDTQIPVTVGQAWPRGGRD